MAFGVNRPGNLNEFLAISQIDGRQYLVLFRRRLVPITSVAFGETECRQVFENLFSAVRLHEE